MATARAYAHLGLDAPRTTPPPASSGDLFEE
jgi:hypothetical protein